MSTVIKYFGTALVAMFLLTGCDEGPMEDAGEELDQGIEETQEGIEEAGEETEETFE